MNPGQTVRLVVVLCTAEVLGMAGFATFPALLPTFQAEWAISNTDAGWISGIYYAGYLGAVPVLVSLTDRVDPRRVYLICTALGGISALGFALVAEGFWTALVFRVVGGIGLAGTYMPGLKALSDRIEGPAQFRALAFYTSSFGIGSSFSFLVAGEIASRLDWHWAFGLSALGSLAAMLLVLVVLQPAPPPAHTIPDTRLLDFRPVLARRGAMAYILAYCAHNWELFSLRAWIVSFLAFSQAQQADGATGWPAPTVLAALIGLIGVPASIVGNEFATRYGRRLVVTLVMGSSALLACIIGFTAAIPFTAVVLLVVLYNLLVNGDSASITSGAMANAPSGYRGTTMALHACIGFAGAFLGPLAAGVALDLSGAGQTTVSWGFAFMAMGVGAALGPLVLFALGKRRP